MTTIRPGTAGIPTATAEERIRAAFDEAGVEGFFLAREIDGDRTIGVSADEPVVLASVFKIPVALAYAREAAAGRLERTERLAVDARYRDGGIGTSGCADPIEMSLRDLVHLMLTMSDNAATDVVLARVGLDTVNGLLRELGLERTHLVGGCLELISSLLADLGASTEAEAHAKLAALGPERIMELSVCVPELTTRSTARETAELLARIWRDEAGSAVACAEVRAVMAQQIWPHRLGSGFDDSYRLAAKTGTLPGWRNEAGVIEHPGGGRWAVAVFTRSDTPDLRNPRADRVIGQVARLAVDELRSLSL
ncbi:Beta-lactamase regulatory protein BlaB [Streptomyces sp. ADI92-24]|uniref:serine hydrolase n=1 Tax=unclassified Streptomyces TaxID=2593676 RepID=UPI000F48F3E3|nr:MULTISPECIES: serine hydrolase [unclassified Streptomyces]ROQ78303.1 beta-lactamase class A [Streptomyces sp. CEV 2-1]RPK37472.1 Beta-lactamase regulatory protein BlaB [Streptomyces sp. ADI92-24]